MATLEERPCGEALRGWHPAHTYMQNACAYQCPGGDVLHDFPDDAPRIPTFADVQSTLNAVWQQGEWQFARPPAVRELAEALRLTREFVGVETLPAVAGWSWYDALVRWAPEYLPGPTEAPCVQWAQQEPHDAHDFASADGPAHCPGWSEPGNGPGPQPGEPPTDAERIRDLEHTLQRAREALGTTTPATGCEGHQARITALEDALREVLAKFVHTGHPGEPCKQTGWVRVDTLDHWHAVLRGEAS